MKTWILILLLCLAPQVVLAPPKTFADDQPYLEVTAPANRKLQLLVAPPTILSGAAAPEVAKELADLFSFDLNLAGTFALAPAGTRPDNADLVLSTAYSASVSGLTVECRLFDRALNRELTAKRFTGTLKDLRRIGHAFSDEVLRAVTGLRGPFTGKIAYVVKSGRGKEIYLMDYDGRNPQRITNNGSININPDFAPSGREIIYTSYKKGNPDLFRRELFTGLEARISARSGLNATAAYAPDGNRIALTLTKDGNSEIYVINKEGRELARLTHNAAIDVSPAWSPDGRRIVFNSDRLGKPQLFVMDADGTNVRRLTTSGNYNVTPRWAPKGDRIAYARQESGGFQIYAINSDGTGDTQLTTAGSNEHPRWSPDGRFIVFSSTRDGGSALYIMRADGTGQTRVSPGKGGDSHPCWSAPW
ncbi:Tol-Pal system beta propeller repeat protein TolB [Geomesophilobacter sediminis]|uniref:Tol-Pal system beta propeller repeat protein TolB n=1 Tax=Geomesophilobacter sediminis TaxID=2798584 RepID=A0A8J7J498_9BACT|nr:Tol-Pal system beta propeller repeat protein TolB [Geomesophilobacter sediminis]MBJ6725623.1 Tol-Pal system beta propeller repeat protein TolB [Geomesophilobacter sediminis]